MRTVLKDYWWRSGGAAEPIDYSPLYTSFDHLLIPDAEGGVYSDTGRTTAATDGDAVKNITDLVGGNNLSWISTSLRRSFLDINHGSSYDLTYPIYKKPSGQKGHISFFNILDSRFQSGSFTAEASPNTAVFVIRSRRAVSDEGGVSLGVGVRDRSQDHLELSNNAGAVELDNASGVPNYDRVSIIFAVDNGTSSTVYLNNSALGTVKTLSASSISQLLYGTNSHIWEHDLFLAGTINAVLSTGDRNTLYSLLTGFYTVDERPQGAHAYDVVVAFDGTDTFTCTSSFYDPNGLSENTSLAEYEWFIICARSPVDFAFGESSLESQLDYQRIVYTKGNTLKRSDNPGIWQGGSGGSSTPGDGDVWVACRKKSYNTNGQSWSGIPFRSLYINDNVTGTFTSGKPFFSSVYIKDGFPTRIYCAVTDNTNEDLTGVDSSKFTVLVDGASRSISSITTSALNSSFGSDPYSLYLTIEGDDLTYDSDVIVKFDGDSINSPTLSYNVPEFYTNPFLPVENNLVGPVTMKINFGWFTDATNPEWVNLNADGSVTTIDADVADINGSATGIALAVTNAFQGWGVTDKVGVGTLFDEANIVARGLNSNGSADTTGTLRFSGLGAGATFDLSYAVYDTNGGTGSVTVTNGAGTDVQAIDSSVYTEYTKSSLTADASGNVDITVAITASGKDGELIGLILTVYP